MEANRNLQYGRVLTKDGNSLLRVSYKDGKGIPVEILVKPNPTSASELISVQWGSKAVDPLPIDNLAVLDVEAQLRLADRNVAELDGIKFCSLWTLESHLQPEIESDKGRWEMLRTQNMADTRYIFGRLWQSNNLFDHVVYWTKHFKKDDSKPVAWIAVESGLYITVNASHRELVERLYRLITENDEGLRYKSRRVNNIMK